MLAVTQGCTSWPWRASQPLHRHGLGLLSQGCATSGDGCGNLLFWAAQRKGLPQALTLGVVLLELTHITPEKMKEN